MQANTATAGTADELLPANVPQYPPVLQKYTDEQVRQFVAAIENPFDPGEIKWRVTNTTSDRRRGQVIAYADPRAYTDRLNALFTVRGWTREYAVQVIQNFGLLHAYLFCGIGRPSVSRIISFEHPAQQIYFLGSSTAMARLSPLLSRLAYAHDGQRAIQFRPTWRLTST